MVGGLMIAFSEVLGSHSLVAVAGAVLFALALWASGSGRFGTPA